MRGWASVATLCGLVSMPVAAGSLFNANIGSLGAGVELAFELNPSVDFRLAYQQGELSESLDEGGVRYNADLELEALRALLDWYPLGGGFRLTAGLSAHDNKVVGTARPTTSVSIGNTSYTPAQIGALNASIDFGSTAPYLGIGWGNKAGGDSGLSLFMDLGLMLQDEPEVSLIQQGGALQVSATDLAVEEAEVEQQLDDFEFYPVFSIGLSVAF